MLVFESHRRQEMRELALPRQLEEMRKFSKAQVLDQLRAAMISGDLTGMLSLVKRGAPPETETAAGCFPIMSAVLLRSRKTLEGLLAAGASIDYDNSHGMTALMWAVKRDDFLMASILFKKGADIGYQGLKGRTAMHVAAACGRQDMVDALCDTLRKDRKHGEALVLEALNARGAGADGGGLTPVMLAAIGRNEGMVRHLMRQGADPGLKDHQGLTASDHARRCRWASLSRWLASTRAIGKEGVYTYEDLQEEKKILLHQAKFLRALASGAMMTEPDMQAIPATYELINTGLANPNQETEEGHTALISSAYQGQLTALPHLIQGGCLVDYANRNGRTALMAAAAAGRYPVVLELLRNQADPTIRDMYGKNAGYYAQSCGHEMISQLLTVAADRGYQGTLEWDAQRRRRRDLEANEDSRREALQGFAGVSLETPEIDIQTWIARLNNLSTTSTISELTDSSAAEGNQGASDIDMEALRKEGVRCPKCTLPVPCDHFTSIERVVKEYPEGVPDWRWIRRPVKNKRRLKANLCGHTVGRVRPRGKRESWREMHQGVRERRFGPVQVEVT
ncbi:unnamed protein product [Chrysoparadoxa australica]